MKNLVLKSTFMLLLFLSSYGLARAQTDCCALDAQLALHEDFTAPVTNIAPDYTVTTTPSGPGQIAYQNGTFASTISNGFWNVNGSTSCTATDPMMLVNGRTGILGEAKVYESGNLSLIVGQNYNICARVKDLAQCAFNVAPQVRLQVVAMSLAGTFILYDSGLVPVAAGPGNCDYITINGVFAGANTSLLNVRVRLWLDESGLGDGNDIAVDDIVVLQRPLVDPLLTEFRDSVYYPTSASTLNIKATAMLPLPAHCTQSWTVCELSDPNDLTSVVPSTTATSGPGGPWGSPTFFPGYCCTPNNASPNGIFFENRYYLIRRTVECECEDPDSYIIIREFGPESTEPYYSGPESEFPGEGVSGPNNY